MSQQTVTRRDPMTEILPFEALKAAHELVEAGQNEVYWGRYKVPKRPIGEVRHEVARQVATFMVPLLGLVIAGLTFGVHGVLAGLPVAWFVGFLLDTQLKRAINKRWKRDSQIDAGRYAMVMSLCANYGLRPEEVTLDVVRKMDKDYEAVMVCAKAELARRHEAQTTRNAAQGRNRNGGRSGNWNRNNASGGAPANDWIPNTGTENYIQVNGASGLPMFGPLGIDAAGNSYGQDMF